MNSSTGRSDSDGDSSPRRDRRSMSRMRTIYSGKTRMVSISPSNPSSSTQVSANPVARLVPLKVKSPKGDCSHDTLPDYLLKGNVVCDGCNREPVRFGFHVVSRKSDVQLDFCLECHFELVHKATELRGRLYRVAQKLPSECEFVEFCPVE